jgi:hypothetical protein
MFAECSEMAWIDKLRSVWRRRGPRRAEGRGWTAIYVGDYKQAPSWVYTVGFKASLGEPEIIVFDLPRPSASQLVSHVHDELRSGRLILLDGVEWAAASTRCVWRKVHEDHLGEWLTLAFIPAMVAGGMDAFQLVLSDAAGRLPWEDGYDERLRALQPALYEPPAEVQG